MVFLKTCLLTATQITWLNSSLYFIRIESPNEPILRHKERRVIKLSVKCKLLLAVLFFDLNSLLNISLVL